MANEDTGDLELIRMMANPEFIKDPVFSKLQYLSQASRAFLEGFLYMARQASDTFAEIHQTHVDEKKICLETQMAVNGKVYPIAAWMYDLGGQEAPDMGQRISFLIQSKKPIIIVFNPSTDKTMEHVLLRRVLRIQIETDEMPFKGPPGSQFVRIRELGWYVAEIVPPKPS